MSDKKERRARAKFQAAIDSVKDALIAASQAAHEIELDDAKLARLMELSDLNENAGMLSAPDIFILNELACQLIAMHESEGDEEKAIEPYLQSF